MTALLVLAGKSVGHVCDVHMTFCLHAAQKFTAGLLGPWKSALFPAMVVVALLVMCFRTRY